LDYRSAILRIRWILAFDNIITVSPEDFPRVRPNYIIYSSVTTVHISQTTLGYIGFKAASLLHRDVDISLASLSL